MPSLTCDRCLSGRHRCMTPECACACRPIAARVERAIEEGEATAVVHGRAGNYHRGVCREACCREPAMDAQRRRRAAKRAAKMSGATASATNHTT